MRIGRRKRARSQEDDLTRRTREESRAIARKQRAEARSALRGQARSLEEVRVRVRGTALEGRRQLRPVLAPVARLLSRIAPYLTATLLFVVRLIAAIPLLVLAAGQAALGWLRGRGVDAGLAGAETLRRVVTPMRTAAFVGIAAAVALGVSQFFDYRGVAVDAPAYEGEIGATAPVPITDREVAGDAHFWILLILAAVALVLVVATYRARTRVAAARLAGAVSLCGMLGIAVALAIDLPQGLDAGRAGIAFSGTEAQLLEGFWAEIAASAVLILSGGLLALYSRGVRTEKQRRSGARKPAGRRRPPNRGVSPGLQAGS
jgi:hypothetical protein